MLLVPKIKIKIYGTGSVFYASAAELLCDDGLIKAGSVAIFKCRISETFGSESLEGNLSR